MMEKVNLLKYCYVERKESNEILKGLFMGVKKGLAMTRPDIPWFKTYRAALNKF